MGVPPSFPRSSLRGLAPAWTLAYVASVFAAAAVGIIEIASSLAPARFWSLGAVAVVLVFAGCVAGLIPIKDASLQQSEAERLLRLEQEASRRETENAVDVRPAPNHLKKSAGRSRVPMPPVIDEETSDE